MARSTDDRGELPTMDYDRAAAEYDRRYTENDYRGIESTLHNFVSSKMEKGGSQVNQ